MREENRETLKLVANILGNISAISAGIALFEKTQSTAAIIVALIFAGMAVVTIRNTK